jgi:superfamily II DNA or RNA helicase
MPESLKDLNRPRGYDRRRAVEELENGKIKVVFTVGMFNEGVDIPSVDSILLLRPTESYVIFL